MLSPGLVPYRVSVDQYEAMVESGVFTKHDRLELIEGLLVVKMTKGTKHSTASELCRRAIERVIPAAWHVRAEKPVRVPGRASEPEPDLSVVRGSVKDYTGRNPEPGEVALVVEVSESSLTADQTEMVRVYGGGGIPVYWIVNLRDGLCRGVHRSQPGGRSVWQPRGLSAGSGRFGHRRRAGSGPGRRGGFACMTAGAKGLRVTGGTHSGSGQNNLDQDRIDS